MFLDPSRISMPDVDIDFCYQRRQEMVDYVVRRYGRDSISQIITFGTMASKGAIKAVGRALDVPYSIQGKISGMMEGSISDSLSYNQDLKSVYEKDDKIRYLVDTAKSLEGLPLYTSTHAAGVLITDSKGVIEHVPLWMNDGSVVAQYSMDILDDIGMLKEDFLGLKTLTIIDYTIKNIKDNYDVDISLDELYERRDPKVFKIIQDGLTDGIFQIEGSGMTDFMKELSPENMSELMAGISLYRPGPMQYIPEYLKNRRNRSNISYRFKELEPILSETYGILTYQEQCMKAVIAIAGYEKHHSDGFRKAIAKKRPELIAEHRQYFIYGREEEKDERGNIIKDAIPGGLKMGHNKKDLEEFYSEMEFFGKYAFNKSHAAAYAVLAYATAWLKTYYPSEFMSATIDMRIKDKDRVYRYLKHTTQDLNIEMTVPDINTGDVRFTTKNGKIIPSLIAKDVKEGALKEIISERSLGGEFKSMNNFFERCFDFIDKSTFQTLVYIGAFDSLGIKRSSYLAGMEDLMKVLSRIKNTKKKIENNEYKVKKVFDFNSMFSIEDIILDDLNEIPEMAKLKKEKELLGFYISGHPLKTAERTIKFADKTGEGYNFKTSDLNYIIGDNGETVMENTHIKNYYDAKFPCVLAEVKVILTRAKKHMAILKAEDFHGSCKVLVFPNDYEVLKEKLEEGIVCILSGKVSIKSDEAPFIICNNIDRVSQKPVKRIIITPSDTELFKKELLDKRMYGDDPTYLNIAGKLFLLERKFWLNRDFVIKYFDRSIGAIKIENW